MKRKKLSNPFSTGGGGSNFEGHVQATFVALMLTGGNAPCLPCWPIKEVKLQGKIDGYDTDDLIVVVEDIASKQKRKLLGQVKYSIDLTKTSALLGEVMKAAWDDFNNPEVFARGLDVIALITGQLTKTDSEVAWLLNHARTNRSAPTFFRNVATANFSSEVKRQKLQVIRDHLTAANGGANLTDEVFHEFLASFYLLGYDLGEEDGVVLSLINSHLSQFRPESSRFVWSRILEFTNNRNHHSGCISRDDLPKELVSIFVARPVVEFPDVLARPQTPAVDWARHEDAVYLALATLIGSWSEEHKDDVNAITQLLGINYDDWLAKARKILHLPNGPLSVKNGVWRVVNRSELWELLGSHVLDQNLATFGSLAVSILKERDPAFELPPEERYAARVHGKVLSYSHALRKGIAEGLAMLSTLSSTCVYCTQGKAEATCTRAVRELLKDADWLLWGSLNDLLPNLAEAAPSEFLEVVEKAMDLTPCPFDELFSQEGDGFTGGNYLTGLFWALEGLAWDEKFLVRVCVVLGELASHDPGGKWANRPSNSLATILLPWLPQTLASIEKREVAVRTILKEQPEVGWNLVIKLLPGQHQISSGSHKPIWRKTIPDNWEKGVTNHEYWQQASVYAELAVAAAARDIDRLAHLIDHFDKLPRTAFDQLIETLSSQQVTDLPQEQRRVLWNHLAKLTNKHRLYSDMKWALPNELLVRIEQVTERLAPEDPFNAHQHLFTGRDSDLYNERGNWEEQRKKLESRRDAALLEVFQRHGKEGVIRFAESVTSPERVGYALGEIADDAFEAILLPDYLLTSNKKHEALVNSFIWRRYHTKGWEWCGEIDKSTWTDAQIGQFLAFLPFKKDVWDHVAKFLGVHEIEYWTRANANAYQADSDITFAVEKLIEHARPHAAIGCLDMMRHAKNPIDNDQCVRALLLARSTKHPRDTVDSFAIVELIKYLQAEPAVDQDDLFRLEWAYLPLLDRHLGASPKLLEIKLANDPQFFCEVIQLIYRSRKQDKPQKESTEESTALATNAWHLLHEWKSPPGTDANGTFSGERFAEWMQQVKTIASESGHLEVALINVGEVLIYAPVDPNGLWIHSAVATALNDRDADAMRDGFRTGSYNSRGVHWVDPSGNPERELAEEFRSKAAEVENAGFQRFAVTLKALSETYRYEAERIIDDHKDQNNQ